MKEKEKKHKKQQTCPVHPKPYKATAEPKCPSGEGRSGSMLSSLANRSKTTNA